jgi:hypothetical protein
VWLFGKVPAGKGELYGFFTGRGGRLVSGAKTIKKRWGQRLPVDEFSLGFICVSSLFNFPPISVARFPNWSLNFSLSFLFFSFCFCKF